MLDVFAIAIKVDVFTGEGLELEQARFCVYISFGPIVNGLATYEDIMFAGWSP